MARASGMKMMSEDDDNILTLDRMESALHKLTVYRTYQRTDILYLYPSQGDISTYLIEITIPKRTSIAKHGGRFSVVTWTVPQLHIRPRRRARFHFTAWNGDLPHSRRDKVYLRQDWRTRASGYCCSGAANCGTPRERLGRKMPALAVTFLYSCVRTGTSP